jgi:hypothetical protein
MPAFFPVDAADIKRNEPTYNYIREVLDYASK